MQMQISNKPSFIHSKNKISNSKVLIKRKRGRPRKDSIKPMPNKTVISIISETDIPEEDRSLLELLG